MEFYPEKDRGTARQATLSCYPLRGVILGGYLMPQFGLNIIWRVNFHSVGVGPLSL